MRRYPTRSNPGATVVSGGSVSPVHSLEKQGSKRVGKKGTQILEFNAVQIARAKHKSVSLDRYVSLFADGN